jgi:murein DD-endopeptidase MepM/ murein hydrolase activator NlpD
LGGLRARVLVAVVALAAAACASDPEPEPARYHVVQRGETVYSIARRYGVQPESVIRANGIGDVHAIAVGTSLWIPGAGGASRSAPPRARPPVPPDGSPRLVWPVQGRVTSGYGRRNGKVHDGVDIGAKHGSPIRAAAPGKVIFAGRLGAYGRTVVIKHEGHYRTVYAHARQLHVRKGEFVEAGERIATVGTSGNATGPHLHFEVRRGERAVDPLVFLP